MRRITTALFVGLALVLPAFHLLAHHALATEFDESKTVKLKGVVKVVAYTNPHAFIYVDAPNDKGDTERWALETLGTNQLNAYGLGRTSLKVGDVIEVCGFATKEGVNPLKSHQEPEPISLSLKAIPREVFTGRLIWLTAVTLPDGRKLAFGQAKC